MENYLKEKRIQLAFLVLVIGLGVAISGLSPYVFGEVIDIFSGEKQGNFKTWILFYALLLLLSQLFSVLESLTGQWIVTSIENQHEVAPADGGGFYSSKAGAQMAMKRENC